MYNVIDNFLDQADFLKIKNALLSDTFPWYYGPTLRDSSLIANEAVGYNFQFTHLFYTNNETVSTAKELITPILQKLDPFSLIRIKANLNVKTHSIITQGFHVDYKNCKTAIFYVNNNNGKTIFADGTTIDSIENRMVIFDSNLAHTGTTCTNENVRCVINFNFIDWSNHE
jgi:hypothetical protein